MRVLLGLLALAVGSNAQTLTISTGVGTSPTLPTTPSLSTAPPNGQSAQIALLVHQNSVIGTPAPLFPTPTIPTNFNTVNNVGTGNWAVNVGSSVNTVVFEVRPNAYVSQMQYRLRSAGLAYTCDPCSTPCDVNLGPGGVQGSCATFIRLYTITNLVSQSAANPTVTNNFIVQVWDVNNRYSYSIDVNRLAPAVIVGDPQIVGMQGQDFQVHGMPDEIFNIVTYPSIQVNARFTYLEAAECHDNYTACFAHPGTYISEEGFRIGKDKVRVTAGSFKKGLTVHVNGKRTHQNVDLKHGAVEVVNHRRVVVHTDVMKISVTNSDKFMNQEIELKDDKLVALGAERRVLKDNERFHSEVPLHGLQGQTWRNVEYASGLEYEGSIMDYHVVDGNLFGTDFVFNQFQA